MTPENEHRLVEFIRHLLGSNIDLIKLGQRLQVLVPFLDKVDKPGIREYQHYLKENFATMIESSGCVNRWVNGSPRVSIPEFLAFIGKGYGRKNARKPKKTLKLLTEVSEENMAKINRFLYEISQEREYSEHTLRIYREGMRRYFKYSNIINQDAVKAYKETLVQEGLKPATICARLCAVRMYAQWAKIPLKLNVPKVKRKLDTNNIPTLAEYNRLLAVLASYPHYHLWVKIMGTTGCRRSELYQLTFRHIASGTTDLQCKGGKWRRFFFRPDVQKEAKAYMESLHLDPDDRVVMRKFHGRIEPISDRGLCQGLQDLGSKAGIDKSKMHPHAFRHFFAKMYLASHKDDISGLADLLGHSRIDTTMIYIQKSYEEQQRTYNRAVTW